MGTGFGIFSLLVSSLSVWATWWLWTHDAIVVDEDGCHVAPTPLRQYDLRFEEIRSWEFRPAVNLFDLNLRVGKTLTIWISPDGVEALEDALLKAGVPSELIT